MALLGKHEALEADIGKGQACRRLYQRMHPMPPDGLERRVSRSANSDARPQQAEARAEERRKAEALAAELNLQAFLGLGRMVALHHRSSTPHPIHEHSRCLYF